MTINFGPSDAVRTDKGPSTASKTSWFDSAARTYKRNIMGGRVVELRSQELGLGKLQNGYQFIDE